MITRMFGRWPAGPCLAASLPCAPPAASSPDTSMQASTPEATMSRRLPGTGRFYPWLSRHESAGRRRGDRLNDVVGERAADLLFGLDLLPAREVDPLPHLGDRPQRARDVACDDACLTRDTRVVP